MSIRNIAVAIERIRQRSLTDPRPDVRAAFEEVLDILGRVDEGDIADLIEATSPRPIAQLSRDWPVVDVDYNGEDAEFRETAGRG